MTDRPFFSAVEAELPEPLLISASFLRSDGMRRVPDRVSEAEPCRNPPEPCRNPAAGPTRRGSTARSTCDASSPATAEPDASSAAGRDGLQLRGALWAASRGWRVFPIHPRAKKPPAVASWETRATTDPGQIERWWRAAPYNAGIACGPSGLVVIDLDVPRPGETAPPSWAGCDSGADVLAALCQRHGQPWPGTLAVTTRRGGLHLYYAAPAGVRLGNTAGDSARGLGWLVDVRAHGGYVVAPGSVVEAADGAGRYEFACYQTPAELPGWLADLMTAPPTAPPIGCQLPAPGEVRDLDRYARAALNREMERVRLAVVGGRNAALNKAGYHLGQLVGAALIPAHVARDALYSAASAHFASNPPLTPDEAVKVIAAALDAGQRRPRAIRRAS